MEKSKLQSFINRYYLAGNCEAVTVKANGVSEPLSHELEGLILLEP